MYDVVYRDRAVYLPPVDALVLADLHLGRAAASAVDFPLGEGAGLRDRLAALVSAFDPGTVVFAGDVLHRFDGGDRRAGDDLASLLDACTSAGAEPVLVAGNHDTALAGVTDRPVRGTCRLDDVVVCHGHERPAVDDAAGVALYVAGHDHPAIEIEGQKRPCYLYGEDVVDGPGAGRADLLVLPAFTTLAAGATVNAMTGGEFLSPLVTDADALRPVVRDADADETLTFPPLGRFRHHL